MFYSNLSKTIACPVEKRKFSFGALAVGVLAMVFLIGYFVFAWQEPEADPPDANVPAPLNVSLTAQSKEGALVLATNLGVTTGLIVRYGNVGIGTTGPAGKLHVRSSINSASSRSNYIFLDDSANTNLKGYIGINRNTAAGANREYMSIEFLEEGVHWGPLVLQGDGGNVGIGTTNPGSYKLYVNGNVAATAFYYTSDINLKTNVEPLSNSLEKILSLQGVSFNWKDSNEPSMGLIAQEVEKIFPEVVSGPEGEKKIDYARLIAPLIEAIKEQQKEIKELKAIIQ